MTVAFINTYTDAAPYANAAALTAVNTSTYSNGTIAEVTNLGPFKLNIASTAAVDNTTVIAATTGNWEIFNTTSFMVSSTDVIDPSRIPWGSITSPILAPAGTVAAPSVAIKTAANGFYAPATNQVGLSINGVAAWIQTATQLQMGVGQAILSVAGTVGAPAIAVSTAVNGFYAPAGNQVALSINGVQAWNQTATAFTLNTGIGLTMTAARLMWARGAAVTAANNLTLGGDGNAFLVSGATQINLLNSLNWQDGSIVTLKFATNPTVKYNQTASTTFWPIILSAHVDLATLTANSTLTLQLDVTNSLWAETARCIV